MDAVGNRFKNDKHISNITKTVLHVWAWHIYSHEILFVVD